MRCRLVACGTLNRMRPAMRLITPSFYSRSHDAVIRVYDEAGNVIETHEHKGGIQNAVDFTRITSYLPAKQSL
jgi:hypothetical protein